MTTLRKKIPKKYPPSNRGPDAPRTSRRAADGVVGISGGSAWGGRRSTCQSSRASRHLAHLLRTSRSRRRPRPQAPPHPARRARARARAQAQAQARFALGSWSGVRHRDAVAAAARPRQHEQKPMLHAEARHLAPAPAPGPVPVPPCPAPPRRGLPRPARAGTPGHRALMLAASRAQMNRSPRRILYNPSVPISRKMAMEARTRS